MPEPNPQRIDHVLNPSASDPPIIDTHRWRWALFRHGPGPECNIKERKNSREISPC